MRVAFFPLTLQASFGMVAAGLAVLACAGCGGGDASKGEAAAAFAQGWQADRNPVLANMHPCSLLTEDEIAAQLDLTLEPDQRKASHELNVSHRISSKEDKEGAFPSCVFTWRSVDPSRQQWGTGSFVLHVMTATQLKALEGGADPRAASGPGPSKAWVTRRSTQSTHCPHGLATLA
jgi:hypothetical protein